MKERELTLFSALTDIGDDLVLESMAFLPALGGAAVGGAVGGTAVKAASAGKRAAWVLPASIAACAALVAAVGILIGVVGNAFGFFPIKPPEETTEKVTAEETVEEPREETTEEITDAGTGEGTTDPIGEAEEYRVTFVVSETHIDQPSPQMVKAGQCADEPVVNLPEDGSRVEGWYTTAARAEADRFDFSTPITSDLTLYAKIEGSLTEAPTDPPEEPTDEPSEPGTESEPETEETTSDENGAENTEPMPETVREALTTHTDILQSTMVSWQRNLENVTVERVMGAIERIKAASSYFGATNEGGYYLEVRDGNVYLCRKIVYPIQGLEEEGSQILSEFLGEKS